MKNLSILVVILILLILGGGLTAQLVANGGDMGKLLPVLHQVSHPEASTVSVVPTQAYQFVLLAGFVLINVVGIAVTLSVIFWFLDRGVKIVEAETAAAEERAVAQQSENSALAATGVSKYSS